MSEIQENLSKILDTIEKAANKSGRAAKDITLVAVTKTLPPERIGELLSLGRFELGENRAQELLAKYGVFSPEPDWHMIGHLQTNKVKYIIDKVKLIQSVDSVNLAEEIDKRAKQREKIADILIEVNIGAEDTKYGVDLSQIEGFAEHLSAFPNIRIKGLMCVAPFVKKPEENRLLFKKMFNKYIDIGRNILYNADMSILSMGMSNDYAVAIEEGSNMVRLGTALFGGRA
ncbi:MAG: YggS family pyridoxal phosphate-dependent enzyme [Clostridiales bacterium]|jgi:pyridoxal phosphate enzyme (YggS family)|nr:YggS family pyridoxal phosphate-dependent enzyme [Clostridiales bacterium]